MIVTVNKKMIYKILLLLFIAPFGALFASDLPPELENLPFGDNSALENPEVDLETGLPVIIEENSNLPPELEELPFEDNSALENPEIDLQTGLIVFEETPQDIPEEVQEENLPFEDNSALENPEIDLETGLPIIGGEIITDENQIEEVEVENDDVFEDQKEETPTTSAPRVVETQEESSNIFLYFGFILLVLVGFYLFSKRK